MMAMPDEYGIKPDVFPKNERPKDQKTHVEERQSRMKNDYYEYIFKEVNASVLSVVMTQLRHFSSYTISVKACREGPGRNCSNEVIAHQRTGKIGKKMHIFGSVNATFHSRSQIQIEIFRCRFG